MALPTLIRDDLFVVVNARSREEVQIWNRMFKLFGYTKELLHSFLKPLSNMVDAARWRIYGQAYVLGRRQHEMVARMLAEARILIGHSSRLLEGK